MDQLDWPADDLQAPQGPEDLTDLVRYSASLPMAEAILARLGRHAPRAKGSLAPETERALRKAVVAFTGWAVEQGITAPPAAPEMVAAYVDALTLQGRKPASIRQAVWAIATLH